jgi:type IV pilus assembly protein PilB
VIGGSNRDTRAAVALTASGQAPDSLQQRRRLGEILVTAKLITREQLEAALKKQGPGRGPSLGQILVDEGLVSASDLGRALAEQLGLPFYDVHQVKVSPALAGRVGREMAYRYRVLPLHLDGDALVIGMVDPLNVLALDDIAYSTGMTVRPAVLSPAAWERGMSLAYMGAQGLEPVYTDVTAASTPLPRATDESPVVRLVSTIIDRAISERASDIHIEPMPDRVRVRYRIDGILYDVLSIPLADHAACVSRIKIMAAMDISERRLPQDGRMQVKDERRDVDLRVSTLPIIFGEKVVLRVLDRGQAITSLEQLGMSEDALLRYEAMIARGYGMILVTGPTGSGKTTTLMATLHRLNSPEKNIITVEDPVEYQIDGVNQVHVNVKAGLTFATGLRSILRQDPNIIMVGEIRDGDTAEIAVRSALTGHLVLSTMHTNDAAGALTRLVDMGIEPFLAASSVIGVVSQRLVRKVCAGCRQPQPLPLDASERLTFGLPPGEITLQAGRGCATCSQTGYAGRTGLFEVLAVTPAVRELVNRNASADMIHKQAIADGMRPLLQDGVEKALRGTTSLAEVRRVAFYEER